MWYLRAGCVIAIVATWGAAGMVLLGRTDELKGSPAEGPPDSPARVPELAGSGVRSRGSRPSSPL
jgi:hypothetical protein